MNMLKLNNNFIKLIVSSMGTYIFISHIYLCEQRVNLCRMKNDIIKVANLIYIN